MNFTLSLIYPLEVFFPPCKNIGTGQKTVTSTKPMIQKAYSIPIAGWLLFETTLALANIRDCSSQR